MRKTHPPGGRSGVPAGCWEHTESGTPCFALRRRRARRRTSGRPRGAGHGLMHGRSHFGSSATRPQGQEHNPQPNVSLTGQSHSSLLSLILASIFVGEDRARVSGGRSGRALCLSCSEAEYLSSEPSDQGEITSVVAKRKSNERTSFDHLQVRIPHRAQTTLCGFISTRPSDLLPTGSTRIYTSTYGYSARRDTHPAGKSLSKV